MLEAAGQMRYNGGMATDVESGSVAERIAPLLRALLGNTPPVRIEFWDGSIVESDGPPRGGDGPRCSEASGNVTGAPASLTR